MKLAHVHLEARLDTSLRTTRRMSHPRRAPPNVMCCVKVQSDSAAIVIGTGFSGLSAAKSLSQRFSHVTLLERDPAPCKQESGPGAETISQEVGAVNRQGIPQYRQPHMMLKRGLNILADLFPSYTTKLDQAGAMKIDLMQDSFIFDTGREFQSDKPSKLGTLAASRHLYESVLRTCVHEVDNIRVQTGALVSGLKYDDQAKCVTGVRLKDGTELQADLVVDASGSSSKVADWLEQIGHAPPPTMTVDAGLRYAYRNYEIPNNPDRKWAVALINTNPNPTRMAVMVPIEGNRWQLSLNGYKGHHCPTDEEGFLEFARTMPSQEIYNAIRTAKPLTPIQTYAKTGNFRRLFEKVPPPKGLCVLGDAACAFNPVHGQGMSVGVMGSELLGKCIDKQLAGVKPDKEQQLAALDSLPAAFHQELGKMLDYPWAVATAADAKRPDAIVDLPEQVGAAVPKFLSAYLLALQQEAYGDHYLMTKLSAVGHMIAPPAALFTPDVVIRFVWCWLASRVSELQNKMQPSGVIQPHTAGNGAHSS